jgi:hypothetical protein
MSGSWVSSIQKHVEKHPCLLLRFQGEEWERLSESKGGARAFTVARQHEQFEHLRVPTLCLIFGKNDNGATAYMGLVSNKQAITTLETRIRISRGFPITPSLESAVAKKVTDNRLAGLLAQSLQNDRSVIQLSPKVSAALIGALAAIRKNEAGIRSLAEFLDAPKSYTGNAAMQEDALQTALKTFGIKAGDPAVSIYLRSDSDSPIAHVPIMEDAVIEHDARNIPGFELIGSDVTGRAVFKRGHEMLEVFTANRRDLEHVFGVDLIYLNLRRSNLAMLQYKMLERSRKGKKTDWVYRSDKQLAEEIKRMKRFGVQHPSGPLEYRLNQEGFFMKFVRRDAALSKGGIIMPLQHYQLVRDDPKCKVGKKGVVKISYDSLAGRYMREEAFLALLRSGYIGPHAETTQHFATLIQEIIQSDRAVVGAVASETDEAELEADTLLNPDEWWVDPGDASF